MLNLQYLNRMNNILGKKNKKGFSLIEVILGIFIGSIIMFATINAIVEDISIHKAIISEKSLNNYACFILDDLTKEINQCDYVALSLSNDKKIVLIKDNLPIEYYYDNGSLKKKVRLSAEQNVFTKTNEIYIDNDFRFDYTEYLTNKNIKVSFNLVHTNSKNNVARNLVTKKLYKKTIHVYSDNIKKIMR